MVSTRDAATTDSRNSMAASNTEAVFCGRTFALITGGSQGLGRSIAVGLATQVSPGSVIVITARNSDGLEETAELAKAERKKNNLGDDVHIVRVTSDVCNIKDMESLVRTCVEERSSSEFSSAVLFHNVGTLGDNSKEICDFRDPQEIVDYFNLNLTYLPLVTGQFLDWANVGSGKTNTIIVNISSIYALNPWPGYGMYATGKAARDMLFRVLAAENPKVKVLNWAPGPLLTAMTETVCSTPNKHNTHQYIKKLRDDGKCLTCEQSTEKLLEILRRNNYESGSHLDYFD